METTIDWKKAAAVSLTVALWGLGIYLLFRYTVGLFLPFLLALGVSALVRPLAARLSAVTRVRKKHCAVFLTVLFLALTVLLIVFGCNRLWTELGRLVVWLGEGDGISQSPVERAAEWLRELEDHIPFLGRLRGIPAVESLLERFDGLLSAALGGLVSELSSKIPDVAGNVAKAMPNLFLFAVTFFLSCFYFSADDGALSASFGRLLPKRCREGMRLFRSRLRGTAVRYIRAYLLLMGITFGELFIGFSVLGLPYAFLAALAVAAVDLLPVFGTGTVLVPWAVFRLISGDVRTGSGLLILYGVTLLVRQIIEPHIVGESIGLHPLATLFSMYVGYRLLGFFGLLTGPVIALVVRTVVLPEGRQASKGDSPARSVLPGDPKTS